MIKYTTAWLQKNLRPIILEEEDRKNISEQELSIFEEAEIHLWGLLKLVSLRYIATVYRDIINKQVENGRFSAMYYIDFFSGPGICTIEDSSELCYGSPLIMNSQEKDKNFTKMFFNDKNKSNTKILESWLAKKKKTNCIVTNEKANLRVKEITKELSENCHSLIFVDPWSFQFSWKSMEIILNLNSDIFFLFPTALLQRSIPNVGESDSKSNFKEFFKDYKVAINIWRNSSTKEKRSAIVEMYIKDIKDIRQDKGIETLTESIKIKGRSYYYHMLFITKETSGKSPWFERAIKPLRKSIERYNSKDVKNTLKRIQQKHSQKTLQS